MGDDVVFDLFGSKIRFCLVAVPSAWRRFRRRLRCWPSSRAHVSISVHADRDTGAAVWLVTPPCTDTLHGVELVRAHRAIISISINEPDTFNLSSPATLIDILVISGLTHSAIQTLAFQRLSRLSGPLNNELRKTSIIMNTTCQNVVERPHGKMHGGAAI